MTETIAPPPDRSAGQGRFPAGGPARIAAFAGCGFALAFGWVWSGALRDVWLADVLTGTLFSGQGATMFFAALLAVFLAGGAIGTLAGGARQKRVPAWAFPVFAHGAALLPPGLSLLAPGGTDGVAAGLGLAGGLTGLYWGTILLRLPPALAGLALAVAGLVIAGLAGLTEAVAPAARPWSALVLPPLCAGVALLLAWRPAFRAKAGRAGDGRETAAPARLPGKTAVALALACAGLGALFSAGGYAAPAPWLQAALEAAGTLLVLIPFFTSRPGGSIPECLRLFSALGFSLALPLALLPLTPLWPPAFSLALHFGTGALLASAVMRLAGGGPPGGIAGPGGSLVSLPNSLPVSLPDRLPESAADNWPDTVSGRAAGAYPAGRAGGGGLAGYALAALPVALNAGFYAGSRVGLVWERENAGLAALIFACLLLLFPLTLPARRTRKGGAPAAGFRGVLAAVFLPRGLPSLSRREIARACVTGLGFALTMGWIWFPGMQILCPPLLRTVAPPMGEGAMLFLATLSLGYPLLGLGAGVASGRVSPHLLHGATLPFIFILVYRAAPSPYFTLLFALLAGLASVCAGLYWLTVMFSHRPACAGLSFAVSGFAAAGLALVAAYLPPEYLALFLPLLIALAWPLVLLRPESPPREAAFNPLGASGGEGIWFLVPALFLMGFLEKLLLSGNGADSPALLCLCSALGGAAGLILSRAAPGMRGWKSVCLALLLPVPGLMTGRGAAFSQVATGMVSALVVMELSVYFDRIRTSRILATGVAAGSIAMLFNLGYAVGDGVIAAMRETELVTVLVSLVAAGVAAFLGSALVRRQPGRLAEPDAVLAGAFSLPLGEHAENPENGDTAPEAPNAPDVPGGSDSVLTATEQRVADLLRQGRTNAAISDELGIALTTTRVHLRSIHKKMETNSREELVERLRETADG